MIKKVDHAFKQRLYKKFDFKALRKLSSNTLLNLYESTNEALLLNDENSIDDSFCTLLFGESSSDIVIRATMTFIINTESFHILKTSGVIKQKTAKQFLKERGAA